MKRFYYRNHDTVVGIFCLLALICLAWIYAEMITNGWIDGDAGFLAGCSGEMTRYGFMSNECIDGHQYLQSPKQAIPLFDEDGKPKKCN